MDSARVSKITIARLHNCGNYEHIRYEITVDVATGANPASVVEEIEGVLDDLKPLRGGDYDYELVRARAVLAKPANELTSLEASNLDVYRDRVRKADEAAQKRQRAYERLSSFGGSAVFTDAKENWSDDFAD